MSQINPHDPYGYNEVHWRMEAYWLECSEDSIAPHLFGRWHSVEDMYDEPDWCSYRTYWCFRAHVVDIQEAVNVLCDHCSDAMSSSGTRWIPPDAWCGHDWTKGPCRMQNYQRFLCHMFVVDPEWYPNEEW